MRPTVPLKRNLAKRDLVDEHLPFVRSIAAKLKEQLPREIEFEDLVSYGLKGLLEAAERFDRDHGTGFRTYAYYRVKGAMYDGLRSMGWLPRGEYARTGGDKRTSSYLSHGFDEQTRFPRRERHPPAIENEHHSLFETFGDVAAIFVAALGARSERELADPRPAELLERRESDRSVRRAIERLPTKERRLIELYYYEDCSLEEAGQLLGLSKSWASRLHARALTLVRQFLTTSPENGDRTPILRP
jgi:RNA polymerase sigma factor for flagellar operon FliA